MSTNSSIEWTRGDDGTPGCTWNPVAGCTLKSPGCKNCYAMRMAARLEAMGQEKYAGLTKKVNGRYVWTGKIHLDEESLSAPLGWKKPRRVFVNSMSDLFHPDVSFEFIDKVFAVMALCPQHAFQVLTKRPERMAQYLSNDNVGAARDGATRRRIVLEMHRYNAPPAPQEWRECSARVHYGHGWPLPNIWLGCSTEDQTRADERIPHLLKCPAAVRFLSCEPLLGTIDLSRWFFTSKPAPPREAIYDDRQTWDESGIHWVIVGGESGPNARPMVLGWAKDIVRQCQSAGVPVFVKQLGAHPVNREGQRCPKIKDRKGADPAEWPAELRVREFPQARAMHEGAP
ncbi:MAG TPA: phage Gp37/Gp68 family protein [Tepidisphaeraceae bacterium]|jgi:protein gp37|nr:phage Gp37/Gp68 family protein [Tepidisphaeraceae bacterium]